MVEREGGRSRPPSPSPPALGGCPDGLRPSPLCSRLPGAAFGGFGFVCPVLTFPLQPLHLPPRKRFPLCAPRVGWAAPNPANGESSSSPFLILRSLIILLFFFGSPFGAQPRIRDPQCPRRVPLHLTVLGGLLRAREPREQPRACSSHRHGTLHPAGLFCPSRRDSAASRVSQL